MENEFKTYNTIAAIHAQKQYCEQNHLPNFTPSDGKCYRCNKDIYTLYQKPDVNYKTGISVEEAGNHLITGCPHCHYSFCD